MSKEFHIARAMLLGFRTYIQRYGYYLNINPNSHAAQRIDSHTLEPITYEEMKRRRNSRNNEGSSESHMPWYEDG